MFTLSESATVLYSRTCADTVDIQQYLYKCGVVLKTAVLESCHSSFVSIECRWLHFTEGKIKKCLCAVYWVHIKDPLVVKISRVLHYGRPHNHIVVLTSETP